jgi:hypothetical protein
MTLKVRITIHRTVDSSSKTFLWVHGIAVSFACDKITIVWVYENIDTR